MRRLAPAVPVALPRKFFYLFTCEYCFSHYVASSSCFVTGYRLLLADWRGAILACFALVWIANVYMSAFGRLRLEIKRERVEIKLEERESERDENEKPATGSQSASGAPRLTAAAQPPSTSGAQGLKKNAATCSRLRALTHALGRARRHHDDRNTARARIRQPLNEFPSIAVGHRGIGDDHIGMLLARASKPGFSADGSRGAEPLASQDDQTHVPRVFVVVDHEHHRRTLVALHAIHAGNHVVESPNISHRIDAGVKD